MNEFDSLEPRVHSVSYGIFRSVALNLECAVTGLGVFVRYRFSIMSKCGCLLGVNGRL